MLAAHTLHGPGPEYRPEAWPETRPETGPFPRRPVRPASRFPETPARATPNPRATTGPRAATPAGGETPAARPAAKPGRAWRYYWKVLRDDLFAIPFLLLFGGFVALATYFFG